MQPVDNWKDNDALSPAVRQRLNDHRIKPSETARDTKTKHGWSKAHELYNEKTKTLQGEFLDAARKKGVDPSKLAGTEATRFADDLVKHTLRDEYVAGFNALIQEGKGTVRELNALRATYLKSRGAVGWLTKFRRGRVIPVIATAASVAFVLHDTASAGPEYAAKEFIKSATFYDVTVEPVGTWYDRIYKQAQEGRLNPGSPLGNYLNQIRALSSEEDTANP